MFKCGICHKQSEPGEKAIPVVLQREDILHREGDGKLYPGTRIVKEVKAHYECSEKYDFDMEREIHG